MVRSRPGFFEDLSRHGLDGAWSKRFSSYTVGGHSLKYDQLFAMTWDQLCWYLNQSIAEGNFQFTGWVFEVMLIQTGGNFGHCWHVVLQTVSNLHENYALPVIERLLRYVDNPDQWLKPMDQGLWGTYLVGKVYSQQAIRAKGINKAELMSKKALAMHFLGDARQRAAADPYRQTAQLAAIAATVAAAYEATAYLQFKGTRTAAVAAGE
jgi:hypothetical protein